MTKKCYPQFLSPPVFFPGKIGCVRHTVIDNKNINSRRAGSEPEKGAVKNMLFCIVSLLGPVMIAGSYLLKRYKETKDKRTLAKEVLAYIVVLIVMYYFMFLTVSTTATNVIAQM